jgi:hypothetical protein
MRAKRGCVTESVTIVDRKDAIRRRPLRLDPLIHWQFRVPMLAVVSTSGQKDHLQHRASLDVFPARRERATTAMGCDAGGAVDLGIRTLTKL